MRSEPAVSVIVIFYNAERFLAEAVESVLGQTERSWELVLADDGSTDRSAEIARNYADRMAPKIRYVAHPEHRNRGMSATRNLGISTSSGEFVAFLDADDVWKPDKLTQQLHLLAACPEAGLVYGSPLYWFSWSNELSRFQNCQPGVCVSQDSVIMPPELLFRNYPLGVGPAPCPSDLMVRRSVIERVGGFEESFRGRYQMYEDQAFLAKVYLSTAVFVSNCCWTLYRQHPGACSISVRDSGQYLEVRRFFLEYFERYLRAQEIRDVEIRRALDRAWWSYHHPSLASVIQVYRRACGRLARYALFMSTRIKP
jgi:glycosyltransferase involved in cell wall biosynthesis